MRRRFDNPSGFTLIELMIVVAVMGLAAAMVAQLVLSGVNAWYSGVTGLWAQREAREARDILVRNLRQASASTVEISQFNPAQTRDSQVRFVDADGDTQTFYQSYDELVRTVWKSGSPAGQLATYVLIGHGVQDFKVYYPDAKDMSQVGVAIYEVLYPKAGLDESKQNPVAIQVNATVQLRNP